MFCQISSNSFDSAGYVAIRCSPKWQPDGDVDVFSRHRQNPCRTWSVVMYVSISGKFSLLAIYLIILVT
jgi:hypothetical protein